MPKPSPNSRFYFPELDGLRFFAFLLVFVHHAPVLGLPGFGIVKAYGWIGVDLFFALSAFLFVKILAKEFAQTGTIGIRNFYIRRGLRIWPIYFIFCFSKMVFGNHSWKEYLLTWRAFGLFTFTDNIWAAVQGYNPIPHTAHLWTISYEEQFYLLIPIALLFLFKGGRTRAVAFLSSSALLFLLIRALLIWFKVPHPAIWVLPFTHFESILLGIVVGLGGFEFLFARIPAVIILAAGLFSGWLLTLMAPVEVIGWSLMPTYALIGVSTNLIVYLVFRAGKAPWMEWLSSRPLVHLGKISYGLYVYHSLALSFGYKIMGHLLHGATAAMNAAVFIVSLAITVIIALISYQLIEKPFLQLKKRFEVIHSRPA